MGTEYKYYAIFNDEFGVTNPLGIIRRRMIEGFPADQAITRGGTWEPSMLLRDIETGHSYLSFEEITAEQAAEFVRRVNQELRKNPEIAKATRPFPSG
jgi:hypothetical protein